MPEVVNFLSEAYYAVGITVICVGLVVWLANLQSAAKTEQEKRKESMEKEIDQRAMADRSLTEMILRIEKTEAMDSNKLFRRLESLEHTGTRAMSERTSLIMQQIVTMNERTERLSKSLDDFAKIVHRIDMTAQSLADRTRDRNEEFNRREEAILARIKSLEDRPCRP